MYYTAAHLCCNLGDDLLVAALLDSCPNERFYLFARSKYLRPFQKFPNAVFPHPARYAALRIRDRLSRFWRRHVLCRPRSEFAPTHDPAMGRRTKGIIVIGGSLFIESENWLARWRRLSGHDFWVIDANLGPWRTEEYPDQIRDLLSQARLVSLRDRASEELVRNAVNARYAPDLIFAYPQLPEARRGEGIGISVVNLRRRPELARFADGYESALADLCAEQVRRGRRVALLGFCAREGDAETVNAIARRVPGVVRAVYDGRIDEYLELFNSFEHIVATRFHAMILGWTLRKKTLPVIYSPKQTNVIADLKYSGTVWNIADGTRPASEELATALESAPELPELEEVKIRAREHFAALDKHFQTT